MKKGENDVLNYFMHQQIHINEEQKKSSNFIFFVCLFPKSGVIYEASPSLEAPKAC